MSKMILGYKESLDGAKWVAAQDGAALTTYNNNGVNETSYSVKKGNWFTTTGYYYYPDDASGYILMQTTTGAFINYSEEAKPYWTAYEAKTQLPKYSVDQTQRLVDGIIKNNIHIVENNLFCARYADKLTSDQRKQIVQLQQRVQERMDAISNSGYCEQVEKSYPKGYSDLEPYLAKLMETGGVGLVWWAWCIVAALVVGGFATVAYYVYHDLFKESEEDVKWSDELTRTLQAKLTPEEYEQLKKETQGIVTKAKIQAKLGSYGTMLKIGGVLIAGALVYKFFFGNRS